MTDITELTGAPKHANQHRISRIIVESPNDELRQMTVEVEQYTDQLIEALEKAQQRITQLESRTVKMPEPFKLAKSSSGLTYYFADDVDAALTAAGIKWESE
ncbi:hypothetical protein ACR76C_07455 [Klebsiella grimontii]|uniref:hypothetical protein n=1 Tax=Klebsiella grimontii TaxID=2058152 RepID=UPI003DA516BD